MKAKTRKQRVRAKLKARSLKPRLSVFVSNVHIYAQVIDDTKGKTLAAASDIDVKSRGKNVEVAKKVGELVAQKAVKAGVGKVKFDRGNKKYHGRIMALAQGAREGGLVF